MTRSLRATAAVLALLALGTIGLLAGPRARAEEGATAPKSSATWVYDVRVVRVDAEDATVLEAAPPWQPTGAAGATTTAAWADLLAGVKGRGRATILLDQRLTAVVGVPTVFKQQRRRGVQMLRTRTDKTETWETSYLETGANGELVATSDGLQYRADVQWEERPSVDGTVSLGSASWKGSHVHFTGGETLVLSYRQQQGVAQGAPQGLEIYVFVTGWPVPGK